MDDKLVYTVTGPVGGSIEAFTDALVTEVGPDLGKVLPAGTRVRARVRDAGYPERFAGSPWLASMPYRGEQLAVDAVLDVLAPEPAEELDEAHAVLDEAMTTFQGWRVAATTNIDDVADPEPGEPSPYAGGGTFIRRAPGLSREQFSIEWHIHGRHETARARAEQRPIFRYVQNRIVEPVTPTSWLIDGYEEAAAPIESATRSTPPASVPTIERWAAGPGEVEFFRLPTPMFFGVEYVIAR